MLIALAAVVCGFVWGMIHGQVWLQLNVGWMARAARSLQGVRRRPNRRLEAVRPASFRAPQKFLAALFGTIVTGGMLAVLAANWSFLVPYSIGLFAGFSPAFILAYWRMSALVGLVLLVGAVGVLLYDDEDGPGEHLRASEAVNEKETPEQDASPQPVRSSLPLPPSVEKDEAAPRGDVTSKAEANPKEVVLQGVPPSVKKNEATPKGETTPKDAVLRGIPFAFNDRTIRPEFLSDLNETVRILNDNPMLSVLIEGYADAVGPESFNLRLSRARAEAVRDYLVASGIAADRLRVVGRGEIEPLAPNVRDDGSDNPEGRAINRRVELSVADDRKIVDTAGN